MANANGTASPAPEKGTGLAGAFSGSAGNTAKGGAQ
jgi:hypothetical protein